MSVSVSHCGLFWALGFQYQILKGNLASWGKCCNALKKVTIYSCGSVAFGRSQQYQNLILFFETSAQWLYVDAPYTHGFQEKNRLLESSKSFQLADCLKSWIPIFSVLVKILKKIHPQSLTYPPGNISPFKGTFESMIFRTSPCGICSRSLEGSYPEKSCLEEDPFLLGWPISGALLNFRGVGRYFIFGRLRLAP